jgi:dGTPase
MAATGQQLDDRWTSLLSTQRLCRTEGAGIEDRDREEFERDYDRVIFSSSFRRLKDKTQVFPLSSNDFTRTRLTHSLEVSCIGRSLARKSQRLLELAQKLRSNSIKFESAVSAACLAHDIGNPPFGHSGEAAIQSWALRNVGLIGGSFSYYVENTQQLADLQQFEGNAQAIRVLCRIQTRRRLGGMQLTHTTLGALMKYPCSSIIDGGDRQKYRVEQKKFGYFEDDTELITPALRSLGLIEYQPGAFQRHPLAFLVEAADDIAYAVVDLEDSVDQKLLTSDEACSYLLPIAKRAKTDFPDKYSGRPRLERLRAFAMQALVDCCAKTFVDQIDNILTGRLDKSLIELSDSFSDYGIVKDAVARTAYKDQRVLQVEIAGFQVINGLLEIFIEALTSPKRNQLDRKILCLLPNSLIPPHDESVGLEGALDYLSTYQQILIATDYVSGMTDGFALDLYQKLSGISLPT